VGFASCKPANAVVIIIVCVAASQPAAESTKKIRASVKHGRDFNSLGWTSQHCYCNARTSHRLHRTSQFTLPALDK